MKRIFSNTAFSLLELIIASVLVVVVIMGMFSVNSVLSNNNQDYGQRYLVKSETQITLNHILNNASLAIGSGLNITLLDDSVVVDKGILTGTDLGHANSFCIHQDIPVPTNVVAAGLGSYNIDAATTNSSPSSPSDYGNTFTQAGVAYTATRWLCYTLDPVNSAQYENQIYYCVSPYNLSGTKRGADVCGNEPANDWLFLGSAYSISNPSPTFTFDASSSAGNKSQLLFTITIQNCLDDSAATGTCSILGKSTDMVNNPEVQLSGSVIPSQHGMENCSPALSCPP